MERPRKFQASGLKSRLKVVNWFGVVAGILMLVLPFLGAWWHVEVGDVPEGGQAAAEVAFSPFYYSVDIMGQSVQSSLVGYIILGVKLTVIIGGALLLTGSLMTDRWWGKKLMQFGAMKVFWMIIIFIVTLLVGALFVNEFLPGMMSGMIEGVTVQLNVPYIAGITTSTIQADVVTITAPITASLAGMFWVAVLTAALGLGARIYHGRLMKKFGPPVEKKAVPKVEVKKRFISAQPALGDLESAKKSLQAKSYDESVKSADRAIETALKGWLEQSGLKELKGKDYPTAIKGLKGLKYKVPCEKDIQEVRDLRNKVGLRYSPKKGEAKRAVKTAEKFIKKVQKTKIREKPPDSNPANFF